MAIEVYYVRHRGRVTGPYDINELRSMAESGRFSRIYEVSTDRASWRPADSLLDMTSRATSYMQDAQILEVAEVEGSPTGPVDSQLVVPRETGFNTDEASPGQYHYAHDGRVIGPVSLRELQRLAAEAMLRDTDVIWCGPNGQAIAARDLPELARLFQGAAPPSAPLHRAAMARPSLVATVPAAQGWKDALSTASGAAAAGVLLVCLALPLGRNDRELVWWWSPRADHVSVSLVIVFVFLLLSALTIGPTAFLTRGPARHWVYVVTAGLGAVIAAAASLGLPVPGLVLAVDTLAAFAVVATVAAILGSHVDAPSAQRTVVIVAAGSMLLLGMLSLVSVIARGWADASKSAVILLVASACLVFLVRTAAGLTALTCSRRGSRGIRSAVIILAIVAALFWVISVMGWSLQAEVPGGSETAWRFGVLNAARATAAVGALQLLLGIGVHRLIVGSTALQR